MKLEVNPSAEESLVPLTGGESCLVIDNVLTDPDAARAYAAENAAAFENDPGHYYPGAQLSLPAAIHEPLVRAFRHGWRRSLAMGRPVVEHDARFALVTLDPEELAPGQRQCHRDAPPPNPEAVIAGVLYLFDDPRLGGTMFFESRYDPDRDGAESEYLRRRDQYFSETRGYMTEENPWFRKVAEVEARYNRLILYPGHVYHTGRIARPDLLSPDPLRGRLTLNLFIKGIRV